MGLQQLRQETMMGKEWKTIQLKPDVEYPFVWKTDNWGIAEFGVCPVYKYGKLVEFHMHSLQQEATNHYVYKFDYKPLDWSISSWTHKGMEAPRIWVHFWCKEHKSASFRLYVPAHATHFTVSTYSSFSINFDNAPTQSKVSHKRAE